MRWSSQPNREKDHPARLTLYRPAHLLPAVRIPRARPKPTPESVYRQALHSGDARSRLAVALAGQCGLRRGEIARVRGADLEEDLVGYSLRVAGKGGHVRVVPLPDELAGELLALEAKVAAHRAAPTYPTQPGRRAGESVEEWLNRMMDSEEGL